MSNRIYSENLSKKDPLPLKYGFWYQTPYAMEWNAWKLWRSDIKSKYPIQYFLRESLTTLKYRVRRYWNDSYYWVRKWFKPAHPIVRKSVQREWIDLVNVIVDVNLAIILQFKLEADESFVEWNSNEEHKKFKTWLDDAVLYVNVTRPRWQKDLENAYPKTSMCDLFPENPSKEKYEVLYAEVHRIEKLIEDTDTKYIKEMIDFRNYFWT